MKGGFLPVRLFPVRRKGYLLIGLLLLVMLGTASMATALDFRIAVMLSTARQVKDLLKFKHFSRPEETALVSAAWRGAHKFLPALPRVDSWELLEAELRTLLGDDFQKAQVVVSALIRSMVDSLGDPYTVALTPKQKRREERLRRMGAVNGIGVELGWRDGLVVVAALEHSSARRAGVISGDRIVKIDGHEVGALTFYQGGELLLGEPGTIVHLVVERYGRKIEIPVTRQRVQLPAVKCKVLADKIGLVRIGYFGPGVSHKLAKVLQELKEDQVEKLIVDLRNNPGGDLEEAVAVASLFVSGPVVILARPTGRRLVRSTRKKLWEHKAVFLVNRGSASSSEIVAQAVAPEPQYLLLGETTFGKARVQTEVELPGGGALFMTTAHYLTRSGQDIDGQGVTPEVKCPVGEDPIPIAVRWLR